MKTLQQRLRSYITNTRRAAKDNMKMSVAPKGQICSENRKVVLRNISIEQSRTADQLERILNASQSQPVKESEE